MLLVYIYIGLVPPGEHFKYVYKAAPLSSFDVKKEKVVLGQKDTWSYKPKPWYAYTT